MKFRDICQGKSGEKYFLLGNEAIVRGALEGGLSVAATYPGTPSSEIGNVLYQIADEAAVYFEFSVNEKVAMEVAASAAACGLRSMTFMKHVGLNVAADAFMTTIYTGTKGGFLIVVADDPSMHSSQNEQDTRYYAQLARAPMLEPSDPVEAHQMMREGFGLSEEAGLPFIVRTTTRVAHIRQIVEFGEIKSSSKEGVFEKDPPSWVPIPAFARQMHKKLQQKLIHVRELAEHSRFNYITATADGVPELGIIASGCAFNYVMDVAREHNLPLKILKLGMTYPLPDALIRDFLKECPRVLIAEELDPYLERASRTIAQQEGIDVKVMGKMDGCLPLIYEYEPDIVKKALFSILNIPSKTLSVKITPENLPPRPPILCAGCSHRATYYAVKTALRKSKIKDAIFPTDIGCYTLGIQPPTSMADYLLCMGSSIGTACGISKATGKKVISFIGDSTFFHAGLAGLVNAYHNMHNFVLVILDNRTTAMTGHQPNPGLTHTVGGRAAPAIDLARLVEGMGISHVQVVDPYNVDETVSMCVEALKKDELSVIISRRECALISGRGKGKDGLKRYEVDQNKCVRCYTCITQLACPALSREGEEVHVNALCSGCGVCAQTCPTHAIEVSKDE